MAALHPLQSSLLSPLVVAFSREGVAPIKILHTNTFGYILMPTIFEGSNPISLLDTQASTLCLVLQTNLIGLLAKDRLPW